jgi:hypothetical protein
MDNSIHIQIIKIERNTATLYTQTPNVLHSPTSNRLHLRLNVALIVQIELISKIIVYKMQFFIFHCEQSDYTTVEHKVYASIRSALNIFIRCNRTADDADDDDVLHSGIA